MPSFDDAARRVRAFPGDHAAEVALFDHCMHPRSRAYVAAAHPALRRDADDVLQDAFVAFRRFLLRREVASAEALWKLVLRRMCAYHARRARYRRERLAPMRDDSRSSAPTPEEALIERERRDRLRAAIGQVEREQWRDVLLHLLDGEMPRDARARLGLSVGGYAIAKYRAREAVARIVRDPLRSALQRSAPRPPRPPRPPASRRTP